jgi:hypothetical protein
MAGSVSRRTAGRLVLLTWAGALAWLAWREYGKTESDSIAEATVRLSPEAHFYAVKARQLQIGYASLTVDTAPTGFRLSEILALDVPEADSVRRVTRRTEVNLSRSLRIQSFQRTVTGGGLYEQFLGRVEGDTMLAMAKRDSRNELPLEWSIPIPGDLVLPQVLPYRLAFGKRLAVGRTVETNVLDLATGTVGRVSFTATAESTFVVADSAVEQRSTHKWMAITYDTVRAFRIEHSATGTPVVTWVDEHGGLVQSEAALGIRMERSAFELVSFNYRQAVAAQGPANHRLVPAMSTALDAGVRPSGDSVTEFRIAGESIERFLLPRTAWLAGGRQSTTTDGTLRVGRVARTALGDTIKSEYLAPAGPPIDRRVAEQAAAIAGPAGDPLERIGRMTRWVAETIKRDRGLAAPVLPSRVLWLGRGGAEGHAELLASFARSVGYSARVVSGVLIAGDRALGHTWVEVHLDGAWLAVDPTFGQVPASSRLIRVAVGTGGRPIDLVPLLAGASFEPIEGAETAP